MDQYWAVHGIQFKADFSGRNRGVRRAIHKVDRGMDALPWPDVEEIAVRCARIWCIEVTWFALDDQEHSGIVEPTGTRYRDWENEGAAVVDETDANE